VNELVIALQTLCSAAALIKSNFYNVCTQHSKRYFSLSSLHIRGSLNLDSQTVGVGGVLKQFKRYSLRLTLSYPSLAISNIVRAIFNQYTTY